MKEILKIIVCGEGGVGTTTLLYRITDNFFNAETKMTIGTQFFYKSFEIEGEDHQVVFFDLAGQERWRFFQDKLVKGADAAILAFDLTRPMTLENLEEWVILLRTYNKKLPIMLIGTKTDLIEELMVEDEYILSFVEEHNFFDYIKVSSKTGENVNIVFENLLRNLLGFELLPSSNLISNLRDPTDHDMIYLLDSFLKKYNLYVKKIRIYKINDFITLKLENDATKIYIKNEKFLQCKYHLINIRIDKIEDFDEIHSIDEMSEFLDKNLEVQSPHCFSVTPEEEFWGYCSNLQAWAENKYDSRLIHRNLAFPLLRKLTEAGDPMAKKILKKKSERGWIMDMNR
ncbi:MAG: Rab family GTPase [Promethearchaeota archaeon]